MLVSRGENFKVKVYKRGENSYEWKEYPDLTFFARPAGQVEKKLYRIQQGVNGGSSGVFLVSSNLPSAIQVNDKVLFLGREWVVESIGYYFTENNVVNSKDFSEEYLMKRCPKGLSLT